MSVTNTILINDHLTAIASPRPALREVVHVVVQLAGAGVAAGVRAALAAVLHQEAVPALDTCQLGTRHVSRESRYLDPRVVGHDGRVRSIRPGGVRK